VARTLPTLLVLALLGCTAAAFAVTEGLKLEKSPIALTKVGKVIGPGSAEHPNAWIRFSLRKRDRASIVIVNDGGDVVRNLGRTHHLRGGTFRFHWNGRDDAGHVVPDGIYRPRVHLAREHRTIVLPNPIRVDATAPVIRLVSVAPLVISPDGDFENEFVRMRYRASEPARVLFYLDGSFRVKVRRFLRVGKLDWGGEAAAGNLSAGRYTLRLRAIDRAGNVSGFTKPVVFHIRYIVLRPHVVHVKSGRRFGFRVRTDAKRYSWHFAGKGKRVGKRLLILRAGAPGRYRLVVSANGHVARALVVVAP
jgi:hypothetical protein